MARTGQKNQSRITGNIIYGHDGTDSYAVEVIGRKLRTSAEPYGWDIAEGAVANHQHMRALGYNGNVDNAFEDLWSVGGTYIFPTAGMGMEIISSSTSDASAGIGARTVEVHYLDDAWVEQMETLTLTGTVAVATIATDMYRINNFHVMSVGSSGVAVGDIDLRHLGNTPIYARILATENMEFQAIWTVPINKTAFLVEWMVGIGHQSGNRFGEFLLKATSDFDDTYLAGVFQSKDIIHVQDGAMEANFSIPLRLPAKTDIKISVKSDAAASNALCAGHFEGWYETT